MYNIWRYNPRVGGDPRVAGSGTNTVHLGEAEFNALRSACLAECWNEAIRLFSPSCVGPKRHVLVEPTPKLLAELHALAHLRAAAGDTLVHALYVLACRAHNEGNWLIGVPD